jgi:hypothetical protein
MPEQIERERGSPSVFFPQLVSWFTPPRRRPGRSDMTRAPCPQHHRGRTSWPAWQAPVSSRSPRLPCSAPAPWRFRCCAGRPGESAGARPPTGRSAWAVQPPVTTVYGRLVAEGHVEGRRQRRGGARVEVGGAPGGNLRDERALPGDALLEAGVLLRIATAQPGAENGGPRGRQLQDPQSVGASMPAAGPLTTGTRLPPGYAPGRRPAAAPPRWPAECR